MPSLVDAALELHDLWFGYSRLWFGYGRDAAIRGVSMTVARGTCYGFLGHNGAGKTTVMRLALGLLPANRGTIRLLGHDLARDPRAARAKVGALVERPGFHLHLSARRNLDLLGRLQGMPRRLARAETARVLELVALERDQDRHVGAFSLGMRQRLGIAQAMLGQPQLLLLDEPSNGLDPEGIADLRRLLLHLTRDLGTAVLLSSHQLGELDGLCQRIGVLREGALVAEDDLATLRQRIGARHVVRGTPLPALANALTALGLAPENDGDRLLVDPGQRPLGDVARALAAAGQLSTFAPEPTSLEAIYLHAHKNGTTSASPQSAAKPAAKSGAAPARSSDPTPRPGGTSASQPRRRATEYELRTLFARWSPSLALVVPATIAAWSVASYHAGVQHGLARVAAGEVFSADAGSGHVATALALQNALPALGLWALFFGSQSIAHDLHADTLRNVLQRSVARTDVLIGKATALAVLLLVGWLMTVGTTLATAAALHGFGDLDEVTRHGDRQLLCAAADAAPIVRSAVLGSLLPLLALVPIALFASAAARRPTRALGLALVLTLGGELLRRALGDRAAWLLTSYLPTGWRDDSATSFVAAAARGAADAYWPWHDGATVTPLVHAVVAFVLAWVCVRRLRVG
jgi:lantibiotic transport system ATP-binding protein